MNNEPVFEDITPTSTTNKSPRLPASLTTVTPLSKYLALALFVVLPFVGFLLGVLYGHSIFLGNGARQGTNPNMGVGPGGTFPLLVKEVRWGPCPQIGGCFETIRLFNTGRLELQTPEGTNVITISANERAEYDTIVRDGNLLTKDCPAPPVADMWATYQLYGRNDPITFPGCLEDTYKIDAFLQRFPTASVGRSVPGTLDTGTPTSSNPTEPITIPYGPDVVVPPVKTDGDCSITNCHGLDITCGYSSAPLACTMEYRVGDGCRQFANCGEVEGSCQPVLSDRFNTCTACVARCENLNLRGSNVDFDVFACEETCVNG